MREARCFVLLLLQIMSSTLVSSACRRVPSYVILWNRSVPCRTVATAPLASAPVTPESLVNEQRPQSKESKEHEKTKGARLTPVPSSSSSSQEKVVKADRQARTSTSFVMNLFRGQFYPNEIFPYPNVLNEEQKDNVKMLIDPIWKFFEEKNDPAKNDQLEKVISRRLHEAWRWNFCLSCRVDSRRCDGWLEGAGRVRYPSARGFWWSRFEQHTSGTSL